MPDSYADHSAPSRLKAGVLWAMGISAVGLILSGCASFPTVPANPQMAARLSLGEAKAIIQRGWRWYVSDGSTKHVQVSGEFTPKRIVLLEYWPDGRKTTANCPPYASFNPFVVDGGTLVNPGPRKGDQFYDAYPDVTSKCGVSVPTMNEAQQVAAAFLRWKMSTLAERQAYLQGSQQRFAPIAEQYRATRRAPAIPESVRRFQIIAETAVRQERFADAVDAYLEGLKRAPWWPEGQFNAALMLGKIHYYDEAIEHMQHYLALVPNAPNARAAQDQIYVWQGEEQAMQ